MAMAPSKWRRVTSFLLPVNLLFCAWSFVPVSGSSGLGVSGTDALRSQAAIGSPRQDLHRSGSVYYVSRTGNNKDGLSWATAWNELNQIKWYQVDPGSTIFLDGGTKPCPSPYHFTSPRPGVSCGMEYDSTLVVGASGTPRARIVIKLSKAEGRNGTAVIFGGREVPLPYCHQTDYTGSVARQNGVLIGARHHVTVDGSHRSGIMVYGAVAGIRVSSESAAHLTFKRIEVFDNGLIQDSPGGGLSTTSSGFQLAGGRRTVLKGVIIHDNGQDGIQDERRSTDSLNGLRIDTSWIYNRRAHPDFPWEPFNDLTYSRPSADDGDHTCTHADALQLWSGDGSQKDLTVTHSILGPLVDQGLYPGDGNVGSTWNSVTFTKSLALAISHNIMTDNAVHGWVVDHDTLYAPQRGFGIPSNGTNTITNLIKYGGYVDAPDWSGVTGGNVWWRGDPLPGKAAHVSPRFRRLPTGKTFRDYAAANFAPSCKKCRGSPLHRLADILTAIDRLH